jgi:thiamine-monophosphate kinase
LQLLKVDSVVEGVHFVSGEKMNRVGWKAICRSVSDVASMGGSPKHALVAVHASQRTSWSQLEALYKGIGAAAERFGISVVGGETGRIEGPLVCSVTLTGWVEEERLVLRSGGRVGDSLLVTGRLGGSLRNGHHLDFVPRLKEARWLTKHFKISAMMDISDGLAADAPRLALASGCGVRIDPDTVPRNEGCSIDSALNDGEDFELLLACRPRRVPKLLDDWMLKFPGVPLTRIGVLTAQENSCQPRELFKTGGYHHFK